MRNHQQYKTLTKSLSKLKQKRGSLVDHQKKMGYFIEHFEVLTLLNNIWSFNKPLEMVMSFFETFDTIEPNYKKVLSEIKQEEEALEKLNEEFSNVIPKWEQDLKLKEEIENMKNDLSFHANAIQWLDEIQKKKSMNRMS